jgi:hypothetical protein
LKVERFSLHLALGPACPDRNWLVWFWHFVRLKYTFN